MSKIKKCDNPSYTNRIHRPYKILKMTTLEMGIGKPLKYKVCDVCFEYYGENAIGLITKVSKMNDEILRDFTQGKQSYNLVKQ